MHLLRLLGHWLIMAFWLFNNVAIRMIVLSEAFVIAVVLPFSSHIGTTMESPGHHVIYVPWHRLAFLLALPFVNACTGLYLTLRFRRAHQHNQPTHLGDIFLLSVVVNSALLIGLAAVWPESVVVEPLFALLASAVISAISIGVSMGLSTTPFTDPPARH